MCARPIFLRHFVEEISKPFERDDRIHIEYVPTQVITEWFRTRFKSHGEPVDGILYGSARHSDGVNLVLFIDDDGAVDPGTNRDGALLKLGRREQWRASGSESNGAPTGRSD